MEDSTSSGSIIGKTIKRLIDVGCEDSKAWLKQGD
jgi:hypothetical protein